MKTISLSAIALSLLLFTTAIPCLARVQAAQPQGPLAAAASPPANEADVSLTPSNVFRAFDGESPDMHRRRRSLEDPQLREVMRAEQREQIRMLHRYLREALDIDAATEEKLIDLLTDHQVERFEEFHRQTAAGAAPTLERRLNAYADGETRRVEALRELLGQQGLERYQSYNTSLAERMQVGRFDTRLDPAHKLSAEQKERLVALYREHNAGRVEQLRVATSLIDPSGQLPSQEELLSRAQLQTIAVNEESWRRMPESDRLLRQRAAEILTAPQLEVLAQLHAEQVSSMQQWIENARVQAGLSPEIPAAPEASQPPPRLPYAGAVRLSIRLRVNRNEPTAFTHEGSNGEPVTFASAEGLLVEATPTLYDDERFALQLACYEEGSTGRRLIGQMSQMGTITRTPADSPILAAQNGGSGTVVVGGSKAYSIELSAQVEPL